jgi:predicted nucleic acid-binding protein
VGWVIDTSLWIAVERGALSAADIHAITRQEPVYLSPVNVAEIQFGLDLRKAGRDPHVRINDLWLAAQAIQRGFRLLTSNVKDFADIPGLKLVVLKLP